jgi:hypothetical protein
MSAMTPGRALRLTRSAIFAAVCVVTAALGHVLMSGEHVPGWGLAYAFAVVTAGSWWLTGRERGGAAVTAASVAAQLALHLAFTGAQLLYGSGQTVGTGTTTAGATSMHGMSEMASTTGVQQVATDAHGWSGAMLLAHTVAALACGLWLWRGEKAVFRLVRGLGALVVDPLRFAHLVLALAFSPAGPPPCTTVRRDDDRAGRRRLPGATLRHAVIRRGPPVQPLLS